MRPVIEDIVILVSLLLVCALFTVGTVVTVEWFWSLSP
jgi:hypothetical protein